MIKVSKLFYRYPRSAEPVLREIDLELDRGELLLLLGPNGSGKTTLAKLIIGLLPPTSGKVVVDGRSTDGPAAELRAIRRRVGFLFQNPAHQVVMSIVAADVAFGPRNFGLPEREVEERVTRALELLQIAHLAERPTDNLSRGELQRVALAGLLALGPDYLILDEPCAQLDPRGRAEFLRLLLQLKRAGHGILLISQDPELLALADRVAFLKDGCLVAQGRPREILRGERIFQEADLRPPPVLQIYYRLRGQLIEESDTVPLTVAELAEILRRYIVTVEGIEREPDNHTVADLDGAGNVPLDARGPEGKRREELLRVAGLRHDYRLGRAEIPALCGLDLRFDAGELIGLTGPNGAGKSTLVQYLNGLLRPHAGRIFYRGRDVVKEKIRLWCHVGLVFQDPRQMLFAETVATELGYALRELGFSHEERERRARAACVAVGLNYDLCKTRSPFQLSYGEQVKLGIAAILALEPEMLILDETLSALDPRARGELSEHLVNLNRAGMTIVVIAHRFGPPLAQLDRLLVLAQGRLVADGPPHALLQESWLVEQQLLELPAVARLSRVLGLPLALSPDELIAQLQRTLNLSRL